MPRLLFVIIAVLCWSACANSAVGAEPTLTDTGTLIIVGGGRLPDSVAQRFVALAGGKEARLVVIPTASGKVTTDEKLFERWQNLGVENLSVIRTTDRTAADSEEVVACLEDATGVWFGGGAQARLAKFYGNTAVQKELHKLLLRGGVIGGTSAGAAIQSDVMIASGNPDPVISTGLGFVREIIIDQHFLVRKRLPRLEKAVHLHPQLLGVGIDEATAIEVHNGECRVLGDSQVVLISHKSDGTLEKQTLDPGTKFPLPKLP